VPRRPRPLDLLAIAISVGAVGLLAAYAYQGRVGTTRAVIQAPGGTWIYALDRDVDVRVDGPVGPTVISIHAGGIRVEAASCRDKVCVAMGTISRPGAWIACLPNRLFIRIQGTDVETDATSF
jgi:hypothetical protein